MTARETGPAALGVIALGGSAGALARYGLTLALPTPWATLLTNVVGCALMGVLMAALGRARAPHPLLRPLLGVGVLGGFTTFSTYAVEVLDLAGVARVGYLVGTPVACVLATAGAALLTRRVLRR